MMVWETMNFIELAQALHIILLYSFEKYLIVKSTAIIDQSTSPDTLSTYYILTLS